MDGYYRGGGGGDQSDLRVGGYVGLGYVVIVVYADGSVVYWLWLWVGLFIDDGGGEVTKRGGWPG